MKRLFVALALALGGCAKEPSVPASWATAVTRATDPVDPSCDQEHKLTEPYGGDPNSLARFGNAAIDDYAKLKANYDKCRTWAKGQR